MVSLLTYCFLGPGRRLGKSVKADAVPAAVSADVCILSEKSGHWGNLRRRDAGDGGFSSRCVSQNTDHV